jgi:hypothetical protein
MATCQLYAGSALWFVSVAVAWYIWLFFEVIAIDAVKPLAVTAAVLLPVNSDESPVPPQPIAEAIASGAM